MVISRSAPSTERVSGILSSSTGRGAADAGAGVSDAVICGEGAAGSDALRPGT